MIIRDALGSPCPEAIISFWAAARWKINGTLVTRPAYYTITAACTLPDALDRRFATFGEASAAAIAHGYTVTPGTRDHSPGILRHTETQEALDALRQAVADKWSKAKPCFVRYGRLPPDGRSRNHADGTVEAGVSVFRGERLPNGEARALPTTNQELGSLLSLRGRDLYIVTGREIGTGSDGEPVLANCRIWRKAK